MNPLVDAIRSCVKAYPKPCVNISGGIDSTIILHHLNEKTDNQIHTCTIGFPSQETEFEAARKVAEHYDTIHAEVPIKNMLELYPKILKSFRAPRFNLWPFWAATTAYDMGCQSCYIGEGADEHFGGYWYKPRKTYVEHWSNFFAYVVSTYQTVYNIFGLKLVVPFHPNNLSTQLTRLCYDVRQNKRFLRKAYKGILPDFVVERKKLNGRFSYWVMWEQELKPYFPNSEPKTEDDVRWLLNKWVTREWLKVREWEPQRLCVSANPT